MYRQEDVKALYSAIKAGDEPGARKLLAMHPELLKYSSSTTISWLHLASRTGQISIAEALLQMGLDINKVDTPANTSPLISAIDKGRVDVVRFLLSRGADPNVGRPLIAAINWENAATALEMVRCLVRAGADVNRNYDWHGSDEIAFTPITWAESSDRQEIAMYLRSASEKPPAP